MLLKFVLTLVSSVFSPIGLIYLFLRRYRRSKPARFDSPPSVGGIGIYLSFLAVVTLNYGLAVFTLEKIGAVLICSTLMFVFGVFDDLKEFSVQSKLVFQLLIVVIMISLGVRTDFHSLPMALNWVITILWIVGITNALNHMDILDGLAGILGLISSLAMLLFVLLADNPVLGILCLSLSGTILGFLAFNLPPARIYLGNSGSHFLGFILASIPLCVDYSWGRALPAGILSPLFFLGLPMLDTFILILIRFKKGRLPVLKSDDHISLIMRRKGYSDHSIIVCMAALHVILCAFGLILAYLTLCK